MSLTIYHLHFAQSDRIVWLCEELSLLLPSFKYTLVNFPRGSETSEGKKTLFSLAPAGTAPTMRDTTVSPPVTISESQAIVIYILAVHGQGHLQPALPNTPGSTTTPQDYAQYAFWLSFANGSFQAFVNVDIYAATVLAHGVLNPEEFKRGIMHQSFAARTPNHLAQYEARLAKSRYLAGEEFSAADVMQIYGLTMLRLIYPIDLGGYPNLLRWLREVAGREGYRRAMDKAEDGLPSLCEATVPTVGFDVLLSSAPWWSVAGLKELGERQERERKAAAVS